MPTGGWRGQQTTIRRGHFAIVVDGAAVGGIGLVLEGRRLSPLGRGRLLAGRGVLGARDRDRRRCGRSVDYAFATFDLCRLYAGVFDWNPASARVLEKAGFTFEARLRQAITKDGRTTDELMYVVWCREVNDSGIVNGQR